MTTPLDPYSAATAAFPQPAAITTPRIMASVTVPGGNATVASLGNLGLVLTSMSSAPTATAGTSVISADSTATPQVSLPSGLVGNVPAVQSDTSQNTVTATSLTKITAVWPVNANDAQPGTVYRLSAAGRGTWGSTQQQLTFALSCFGQSGMAQFTVGAVQFLASTPFSWKLTCEVIIVSTGATGQMRTSISGTLSVNNNTLLAGNGTVNATTGVTGETGTTTIDTTSNSNVTLQAQWSSTTGAPTITGHYSVFERLGP